MAMFGPQCSEAIGWDRWLTSAVSTAAWPCRRCASLLRLRPNRHATALLVVSLGGLVAGIAALASGSRAGRWLVWSSGVLFAVSRVVQCVWVSPCVEKAGFGYCQACGYNLRGLSSDRCPECGVTVENWKP